MRRATLELPGPYFCTEATPSWQKPYFAIPGDRPRGAGPAHTAVSREAAARGFGPGWRAVGLDLSPHENLLSWVEFLGSHEDYRSQTWRDLSLSGWCYRPPLTLSGWTHSWKTWEAGKNRTTRKAYADTAGAYETSGLHTHPLPQGPAEPWWGARASQDLPLFPSP